MYLLVSFQEVYLVLSAKYRTGLSTSVGMDAQSSTANTLMHGSGLFLATSSKCDGEPACLTTHF